MNGLRQEIPARLAELLADEAAAALAAEDHRELEQLAREVAPGEREAFVRAASLVQVSCLRNDARAAGRMPDALRQRLAEQGQALLARQHPAAVADLGAERERRRSPEPLPRVPVAAAGASASGRSGPAVPAWSGWAVAACLAVALAVVIDSGSPGAPPGPALPDPATLLARADTVRADFAPSDPLYRGVSGDVVWSDAEQAGYLRLAGLPANDPAVGQYQLWIIDPDRDANPVDGGVFDVATTGEVVIPVRSRLAVDRPTTFAVTLEKPGGVVVSGGPLLIVATVST